jgi:hypothetical protein
LVWIRISKVWIPVPDAAKYLDTYPKPGAGMEKNADPEHLLSVFFVKNP